MLEANNENDAAGMLTSDCKIHVQESKKLLELEKSRNSQMYIEFDDLCYSVRRNRKGKLISSSYISMKVVIFLRSQCTLDLFFIALNCIRIFVIDFHQILNIYSYFTLSTKSVL